MTDTAEHRVVGPNREVVLPTVRQSSRVMREVALGVVDVDSEGVGDRGIDSEAAGLDVLGRDERVGSRMVAVAIDEPDRVEHLRRVVSVEARKDLRDRVEIAVHELAEPAIVVDRSSAGAARDEELEVRDAERVLDVYDEQAEPERVVGGRPQAVLLCPGGRLTRTVL